MNRRDFLKRAAALAGAVAAGSKAGTPEPEIGPEACVASEEAETHLEVGKFLTEHNNEEWPADAESLGVYWSARMDETLTRMATELIPRD